MLSKKIIKIESKIEGIGIFASENIKKGEIVAIFEGRKISKNEADELYTQGFDYLLQIDNELFLYLEEDSKFINHCCNPNTSFLLQNGELIALRDINKNEEITFDYSTNENTDFIIENCRCNSQNCRKKIKKYSETIFDYDAIISPYLKVDPKH